MKTSFNVIGVIPARYESKRLEHKLLRTIYGKTLLQWTWENASRAHTLDKLIIACDHPQIEQEAKEFGAEAVMTSSDHSSGTDRILEAVDDIDTKIIVNIQADEPLIHSSVIDGLAEQMISEPNLVMATVKKRIEQESQINNRNTVKVITDKDNFAIYFSRLPIPCCREDGIRPVYYRHLGIYAYTKDFLYDFKNLPSSSLEKSEKLEQLRAIEAGYKIKVIETKFDSWGVDTQEDLEQVTQILAEKGAI